MIVGKDAPSAVLIVAVDVSESHANPVTPATATVPTLSTKPDPSMVIIGTNEAVPYVPATAGELDLTISTNTAESPDIDVIMAESAVKVLISASSTFNMSV